MSESHDEIAGRYLDDAKQSLYRRTDLLFGALFAMQFLGAVIAAVTLSPRTWTGEVSSTHVHMTIGIGLAALLAAVPIVLVLTRRGAAVTRYTIAVSQMLFSGLLIHLCGGRIETHFHVFGSLAFLAFYRDWKVLVPATIVITADHFLRGVYWPSSIFGVLVTSPWRAAEHAGWVAFETVFLVVSCVQGNREMIAIASRRADAELAQSRTDQAVLDKTRELRIQSEVLEEREERLRLAVLGSQDGLWDWDLTTNKVFYAPRWKELVGCTESEIGDAPGEWLGRIASEHLARFDEALSMLGAGRSEKLDTEIRMVHANGDSRWMLCRAISVRDGEGRVRRLAGSITDITDLKEAQERLRLLAHHDRLTGLPNRDIFTDRLSRALDRAQGDARFRFAVLFGDFDRFKLVNDSLGHAAGDDLLVSIAHRFRGLLRDGDTVARFGGDEFAVLLTDVVALDRVEQAADRFVESFRAPHAVQGHEITSTLSLGIVMSDPKHKTADEMLRFADAAMYQAKLAGKSCYQIFDENMHEAAMRRVDIERDLGLATRSTESMDEQFSMQYQPIVDLADGRIVGFESLVRWARPGASVVSPTDFVRIAEDSGAIIPLGEWTLRRSCEQMAAWRERIGPDRELVMHTNVSRRQLVHPSLHDTVRRSIDETGIRPEDFKIEVTETALMDERYDAASILRKIRETGVELAMDDFGTGQSSLSCLRQFPIQTLKVDRAFLRNMALHREFSAVMQAIITLADNLNLSVVAEGVEDSDQLCQLQAMDCAYGQGFFFSPAVAAADAERMLTEGLSFARNAA